MPADFRVGGTHRSQQKPALRLYDMPLYAVRAGPTRREISHASSNALHSAIRNTELVRVAAVGKTC